MRNILSKLFEPFINFSIQFGHGKEINTDNQNLIKAAIARIVKSSDGKWLPAALAYYIMIAIVPLFSIIFMLIGIITPIREFLQTSIKDLISDEQLVDSLLSINESNILQTLFIFSFSAYSGSRSTQAIHDMSNYLYSGNKKIKIGFIKKKLRALITIAIVVAFIIGLSATIILVPQYLSSDAFREIISLPYFVVELLRVPFTAVILYYTCIILYINIGDRKITWTEARPGALFFALTLSISFVGLSTMLNLGFMDYTSIYGPLAVIMLLGAMALGLSYILFLGMVINISIEKNQKIHGTSAKTTLKNRWRRTFMSVATGVKSTSQTIAKKTKFVKASLTDSPSKVEDFNNNFINADNFGKREEKKVDKKVPW